MACNVWDNIDCRMSQLDIDMSGGIERAIVQLDGTHVQQYIVL